MLPPIVVFDGVVLGVSGGVVFGVFDGGPIGGGCGQAWVGVFALCCVGG